MITMITHWYHLIPVFTILNIVYLWIQNKICYHSNVICKQCNINASVQFNSKSAPVTADSFICPLCYFKEHGSRLPNKFFFIMSRTSSAPARRKATDRNNTVDSNEIWFHMFVCVWQTLLHRMSLSHTKVTDWQSLYKVWLNVSPVNTASMSQLVFHMFNKCWFYICLSDCIQCSVYPGHGATPASVHSALSWDQSGLLWRPTSDRLHHQQSCQFVIFN